VTTDSPFGRARQALLDLDRRHLPRAATAVDRLFSRAGSSSVAGSAERLELAPQTRRILGALALVLLGCAVALAFVRG
jgi:hypothetical protein